MRHTSSLAAVLVVLCSHVNATPWWKKAQAPLPPPPPVRARTGPPGLRTRTGPNQPVIVQLFEWSWDSVAAECTAFIGPAGYKYVQVSPAAEHISGPQWWTSYQVVSYTLMSKRGTRDEYANMVQKCKDAGVGVIADTVWNHMSGVASGKGVAGTQFTQYNYGDLYTNKNFHHCGTSDNDIKDWNSAWEVQNCELENLADLATETEDVRSKIVAHSNDLLSLGVAGFRIDAAKHIPVNDLQAITSKLSPKPAYITQEVIGSGLPLPPSGFTSVGSVTVSDYYEALKGAFVSGNITRLMGITNTSVPSSSATVMVASHDTERNGDSLSWTAPNNAYTLAHIFMLGHSYGVPTVLSSFKYATKNDGAPNGGYGTCSGTSGAHGYLCQHRWSAIANMVKFRQGVGFSPVQAWEIRENAPGQIAFARGTAGFVMINYTGEEWTRTFFLQMGQGVYCDIIQGAKVGRKCTGASIKVADGRATLTAPAWGAVAFYAGAKL